MVLKTGFKVLLLTLTAGCECIINSLLLFFYHCLFLCFFLVFMLVKGVNSHLVGICSVPFDTEDGSSPGDGVSCKHSMNPEMIEDTNEHQNKPNQSRMGTKRHPQSCSAGVEDNFTETEGQVSHADKADEAGKSYYEDGKAEEDILKSSQDNPDDSEGAMGEEREEEQAQKSSSENDDPPGKLTSHITAPETSSAINGKQACGPVPEPGFHEGETEQTRADVGAETQSPEETKGNTPERSCSAETDSKIAVSKHPESFICKKKDHMWKPGCRSFRHPKVLQAAAVASL